MSIFHVIQNVIHFNDDFSDHLNLLTINYYACLIWKIKCISIFWIMTYIFCTYITSFKTKVITTWVNNLSTSMMLYYSYFYYVTLLLRMDVLSWNSVSDLKAFYYYFFILPYYKFNDIICQGYTYYSRLKKH